MFSRNSLVAAFQNVARRSVINFAFDHKEIIYNLGAISSYLSQMLFLWHGIHLLVTKQQPHLSLAGFALLTLTSIILMAPYKWDRKWMRVKSSIGMFTFSAVLVIYVLCWITGS